MSNNEEVKWMTRRWTWKYIPDRYQAFVACIVSAFLYYNVFELFFNPVNSASGACGTLLRPVLDGGDEQNNMGWIWDSGVSLFRRNDDLVCPRAMQGMWWEFFGTFAAIAICGLVMRRAIRREATLGDASPPPSDKSPGWKDDPSSSLKLRWWNGSSWTEQTQYKPRP